MPKPAAPDPAPDGSYADKRVRWLTSHDAATRATLSRKARAQILATLAPVAQDFGYIQTDGHFAKPGLLRRFSIGLQPSKSGFKCFINLGARSTLPLRIGRQDTFRLGQFYDRSDVPNGEPGVLLYPEVLDGTAHLAHAAQILRTRALPFLQNRIPRHRLNDWLAKQPPFPLPQDAAKT
jgi:hypothetical protein